MKHKLIICTLIGGLAFSTSAIAQSSSLGQNNEAATKSVIIDGHKFPMSADEYMAAKKLEQQKKAAQVPVTTQQTIAVSLVSIGSPEEIQNLRKETKQPAAIPVSPAVKPVSAQYADKTIPGTLVPIPVAAVAASTEALVPVQTAVQPKMPELKQQAQKVELETVPASVVQPAVKAPVVPMQTAKGKGG